MVDQALSWGHKDADGRIILRAHVFSAHDDAPAHSYLAGGRIELEQIETFIREFGRRYRIEEIAYDPRFFARSAELLERSGYKLVEFLANSAPMQAASTSTPANATSPTTATRSPPPTSTPRRGGADRLRHRPRLGSRPRPHHARMGRDR